MVSENDFHVFSYPKMVQGQLNHRNVTAEKRK
jgi:hypothetical protein